MESDMANGDGGGGAGKVQCRGVRKWPWGHYAAKIRDPAMKSLVWFETFDTAKKVARDYDAKAVEFCGSKPKTNFHVPSSVINLNSIILSKASTDGGCGNERPSQSSTVESSKQEPAAMSDSCLLDLNITYPGNGFLAAREMISFNSIVKAMNMKDRLYHQLAGFDCSKKPKATTFSHNDFNSSSVVDLGDQDLKQQWSQLDLILN